MTAAPPLPDAPDTSLWDELRLALEAVLAIFGDPASILADAARPRRDVLRLRAWLRALEAIARALLLVLALRLPEPAPRRGEKARGRTDRAARPETSTDDDARPDDSERWAGVSFRAIPSTGSTRWARGKGRLQPAVLPTRPLALRLEALVRVVAAPGRYVRRLRRRITPERAWGMLRRPWGEPDRRNWPPYGELHDDAACYARAALVRRARRESG